MIAGILLAATLSLPLDWPGGCVLDAAHVVAIEPATFSVLATLRCGGLQCFERYTMSDGRRIRESRACEHSTQDHDTLGIAPTGSGGMP